MLVVTSSETVSQKISDFKTTIRTKIEYKDEVCAKEEFYDFDTQWAASELLEYGLKRRERHTFL